MQDFRKLRVWRAAHAFTVDVYRITRGFPREERYGLTSQLRRAAGSIGANLAEGCGCESAKEQAHYTQMSTRSTFETLNHLLVARDTGCLGIEDFHSLERQLGPIRRMIVKFLAKVRLRQGMEARQRPHRARSAPLTAAARPPSHTRPEAAPPTVPKARSHER
jgi:four helix bundle protein